ncbi:MAG: DUF2029 domain-containing protein [Chloroflexi bacterium]|nr:DUF2029 domain-containing protein [Chloroflexota bacterium]
MFAMENIDDRIIKKPTIREFAAIVFVLTLSISFVVCNTGDFVDFKAYIATAKGDFSQYFYGYWLLPFFQILSWLPFEASYILWIGLSVLGVWFAARVFNGNSTLALLSYQMSSVLFWGQITGILCGLLGLFWWAIHHHRWWLAGLAGLLAAAKPQSGTIFVLLLFLFSNTSVREKIRILLIPLVGFILSLLFYPGWILEILSRREAVYTAGNISLWQWIGPWAMLLILPAVLIPATKQQRFLALSATWVLIIPYFSLPDLLTLFIFPVEIAPVLLGYMPGILMQFFGFESQKAGFTIPLLILSMNLIPHPLQSKAAHEKVPATSIR